MSEEWKKWKGDLEGHLKKVIDILEKAGVPRAEAVEMYEDMKQVIKVNVDDIEVTVEELVPPEEEEAF